MKKVDSRTEFLQKSNCMPQFKSRTTEVFVLITCSDFSMHVYSINMCIMTDG